MPKSRRRGQDELCLHPLHDTRGGAIRRPAHMQPVCVQQTHVHTGPRPGHGCSGRGRPKNTDLRSSSIINCTSSVGADTTHKKARVAAKAPSQWIIRSRRSAAAQQQHSFFQMMSRSLPVWNKMARSEEATSKNYVCGRTGLGRDKTGQCAFWARLHFFVSPGLFCLKGTIKHSEARHFRRSGSRPGAHLSTLGRHTASSHAHTPKYSKCSDNHAQVVLCSHGSPCCHAF